MWEDFCQQFYHIDPKSTQCPLENQIVFPLAIFEILLDFVGGPLEAVLPTETKFSPSLIFTSSWLKPKGSIIQALPHLLCRRLCKVTSFTGLTKFETYGFYCAQTDTVFSLSAPFVISSDFQFALTASKSTHYTIENILNNPHRYNSSVLLLLLRVIYPDLHEWIAQNCDEHFQFPERRCEVDFQYLQDFGYDIFQEVGHLETNPKDLLKTVRVGKFRRRKKYSRLKKKKRQEQGQRVHKKRKRPKKANRVHKKRSRSFV